MLREMNLRKLIWTLILFLLLLVTLFQVPRQLVFEQHIFATIDSAATDYVDSSLTRATAAFALARTFNAVISVFRESDIQLEPGGIGVSFAAGAALDPINDLIERFSWVMLASMTSLGIQKVLVEVMPFISIRILFLLTLLSALGALWLSEKFSPRCARLARILLIITVLTRLAIPAMAYLNNQVYTSFLKSDEEIAKQTLTRTVAELEQQTTTQESAAVPEEDPTNSEGWLEQTRTSIRDIAAQGRKILDIQSKLEILKQLSSQLIDQIIGLIVVFVLNTILLPILFLWGIIRLGRLFISKSFGNDLEDWFKGRINP